MKILRNPHRGAGLAGAALAAAPFPSTDAERPLALLRRCPVAAETPLLDASRLARALGLGALLLKDERGRMGLGSFKALGAAYVIARDAEAKRAAGATYATASAGNHGLSVAAGAKAFGARAEIFLSHQVPEAFAERLRALDATVIRAGETYEESMAAAARAAAESGAILLSDSSWPGYLERPFILMEGYLALMAEVFARIGDPPTHIVLQAGVGGLAGAAAAAARARWGADPIVIVVEPAAAPALAASIEAGAPVKTEGPVSAMGRLDCKEPSLIALKGLARDADFFALISEEEGAAGAALCAAEGLPTTPSGAAGVSALLAAGAAEREPPLAGEALRLGRSARVLAILSEGPEP